MNWLYENGRLVASLVVLALLLVAPPILMRFFPKLVVRLFGGQAVASEPTQISLRPQPFAPWRKPAPATAVVAALEKAGFRSFGYFTVPEMPKLRFQALLHPEEQAYAVVYEHDQAGVFTDIVAFLADGRMFTASNAKSLPFKSRPGTQKVRLPGRPTPEVLATFLRQRPAGAMYAVTAEAFPGLFTQAYAQDVAWLRQAIARGDAV